MWIIVLQLVRVACIRTSALGLTNPRYVTTVGIGTSRGFVHTHQVYSTQNDATQLSTPDLIVAAVVTSQRESLQYCMPMYYELTNLLPSFFTILLMLCSFSYILTIGCAQVAVETASNVVIQCTAWGK